MIRPFLRALARTAAARLRDRLDDALCDTEGSVSVDARPWGIAPDGEIIHRTAVGWRWANDGNRDMRRMGPIVATYCCGDFVLRRADREVTGAELDAVLAAEKERLDELPF